jgi:hypothetical protein
MAQTILQQLQGLSASQRQQFLANLCVSHPFAFPVSFSAGGYDIVLSGHRVRNGNIYEVDVSVSQGGVPIDLGNAVPLQFINPEFMVGTGTFTPLVISTGETIQVENTKEDVVAAIKNQIANVLKIILSNR